MQSPLVTIFTMTYNQLLKIIELMRDLTRQTYSSERFSLVVLDDGSTDGTYAAVRQYAEQVGYKVTLVHREHEAHYLTARRWNECIAAADPNTRIWIQVDDVRVRPDFVARHVQWHTDGILRLVTGAKFEGDAETWSLEHCRRGVLAGEGGTARSGVPWTASWAASMSYRSELVTMLSASDHEQPFDTRMVGYGMHEVEFGGRAHLAGAVVVYDPAAGVFHQNHSAHNDDGRGIDHAAEVAAAWQGNYDYICAKHGLAELPLYNVVDPRLDTEGLDAKAGAS